MSVGPASAPRPIHPDRTGSANARESPLGFHVCHVPKDRDRLESRRRLALIGGSDAPRTAPSLQGVGKHGRFRPFTEAVVIGSALRHSAFRGRGGGGARAGRGVTGGVGCEPRALAWGGSHRFGARECWARAAGTRAKVLGGAAGGVETQALLQEQRPAPAAVPAALSGPRACGVPVH